MKRLGKKQKQEYEELQNRLSRKISLKDQFSLRDLKTVAGVDLAYWRKGTEEYAVCCIAVVDFRSHAVLEKQCCSGHIELAYSPPFMAFRELPLIRKTAQLLTGKPDLYIIDGDGYLHPRHMGVATHASFVLDRPTIGIARRYYWVDGKTKYTLPGPKIGDFTDIVIDGEVYGRALRTMKDIRPIFLSVGNRISLDTACAIALQMTGVDSHIPLPTRLADLEAQKERKRILAQGTSEGEAEAAVPEETPSAEAEENAAAR